MGNVGLLLVGVVLLVNGLVTLGSSRAQRRAAQPVRGHRSGRAAHDHPGAARRRRRRGQRHVAVVPVRVHVPVLRPRHLPEPRAGGARLVQCVRGRGRRLRGGDHGRHRPGVRGHLADVGRDVVAVLPADGARARRDSRGSPVGSSSCSGSPRAACRPSSCSRVGGRRPRLPGGRLSRRWLRSRCCRGCWRAPGWPEPRPRAWTTTPRSRTRARLPTSGRPNRCRHEHRAGRAGNPSPGGRPELGVRDPGRARRRGPGPDHGARAVPIYQTTSLRVRGHRRTPPTSSRCRSTATSTRRIGNPTVAAFEERIASLEGGIGAVATSSGQAAEFLTFAALAGAGDHIVASAQRSTAAPITLLDVTLRRFGVETTFVAADDPADFAAAIQPGRTKLRLHRDRRQPVRRRSPTSRALADVAHAAGVPLVGRRHARHAVPVPARSSTAPTSCPLRHQVPRRPRHHDRRRRRRLRPVPLGQRQASR